MYSNGELNCLVQLDPLTNKRASKFFGELKVLKKGAVDIIVYNGDYYDYDLSIQAKSIEENGFDNQF